MKLENLEPKQLQVVDAVEGPSSRITVLGGAGTGKTTAALWAARRYLDGVDDMQNRRVLFLTFSRSAVRQITSKSPGILGERRDRVDVMTFHALCHWLIQTFGRYAGYGTKPVEVQSTTRTKLRVPYQNRLSYEDLLSGATKILNGSERIREMMSTRWGLVICDEVQDTSSAQWLLIELIDPAKVLVLGDLNQMIYSWVEGVSAEQFESIKSSADLEINLEARSHRDPSGLIPAVATAVREREFEHAAVVEAIREDRLHIHFDISVDGWERIIADEIDLARKLGMRDVGVFANHNDTVVELGALLNKLGIDHELVGIPDAHAEALNCMAVQCGYSVGSNRQEEIYESLALYLTACVRGQDPPPMARALISQRGLPEPIAFAVDELICSLRGAMDQSIGELSEIVLKSWYGLGFAQGIRPWQRAGDHFKRVSHRWQNLPANEKTIETLKNALARGYSESLIDSPFSYESRVKLMTYHQTKGREADQTIHVFAPRDYFGYGGEPFEDASRTLYVAISRARKRVVVILPPNPHALVGPYESLRKVQDSVLLD